MTKIEERRQRIRDLLQAQPEGDEWMPGGTIAKLITEGGDWAERNRISQILCTMVRDGELLRTGQPPRGYRYRSNPDFVPEERVTHSGPASAYEGPAVGDGSLCPSIGTPIEAWREAA
jgi:hypothetical protein